MIEDDLRTIRNRLPCCGEGAYLIPFLFVCVGEEGGPHIRHHLLELNHQHARLWILALMTLNSIDSHNKTVSGLAFGGRIQNQNIYKKKIQNY